MKSHGLIISKIRKSFGPVEVLKEVSFSVEGGEFITLLGPSGCGKTTLLRIIAGLEVADSGSIKLGGHSLLHLPANRRPVNTVFQNYALFPHLSVYENVAFGLRSRQFEKKEIVTRVELALGMLQIEDLQRRYPHQLSGGQKQRVALARALVNAPDVLLLDEPMSALDAKLRAEVQLELRRLQRKLGKTFILVTHDQDEAMTVSDRILVMRDGQIEQEGSAEDVYEHPLSRFVAEFLGSANLLPADASGESMATPVGLLRPRTAPAWQRGTLAIRPERILVHHERPAVNAVPGHIRESVFRGDHLDLFVETNGTPQPHHLRVRTAANPGLGVNAQVWLELPPEHLEALND